MVHINNCRYIIGHTHRCMKFITLHWFHRTTKVSKFHAIICNNYYLRIHMLDHFQETCQYLSISPLRLTHFRTRDKDLCITQSPYYLLLLVFPQPWCWSNSPRILVSTLGDPFTSMDWVKSRYGWVITSIIMCWMKLLIHFHTSTFAPLKFRNGYAISPRT